MREYFVANFIGNGRKGSFVTSKESLGYYALQFRHQCGAEYVGGGFVLLDYIQHKIPVAVVICDDLSNRVYTVHPVVKHPLQNRLLFLQVLVNLAKGHSRMQG